MLSDFFSAGVGANLRPLYPFSSLQNVIPVYHLSKHSDPPELITIFDARYMNDTSAVVPDKFSIYHFDTVMSLLGRYHELGIQPWFSKHDWRKFYPSLILNRTLVAGCKLHGRPVQFDTDRAVFGRATEPAIGQAVNNTLWREAWPTHLLGESPVHALQILDDTLAMCPSIPDLRKHFSLFRELGRSHNLVDADEKIVEEVPAVTFAGKHVNARGISHPPVLWAGACLRLLVMIEQCKSKKGIEVILGNLNWLSGHGNVARPFMAPLYHLLHHSRWYRGAMKFVRRCAYAALALAAIPRNVTWGLTLGLPDLTPGGGRSLVYVDAAHDYGLACIVLVKLDSGQSETMQLAVPAQYSTTQQKAERWALLRALGVCCRQAIRPTAVCADNMGSILADFKCAAPSADFWLVRLAQKLARLLVRHLPHFCLSHIAGTQNAADLGTRQRYPVPLGRWFSTPGNFMAVHSAALRTADSFSDPMCILKSRVSSSFPAGGPFWTNPGPARPPSA
jgi:hypothetical protein